MTLISLFLVSHFKLLFIPYGRLSWLLLSFLVHLNYTLSYRIGLDDFTNIKLKHNASMTGLLSQCYLLHRTILC